MLLMSHSSSILFCPPIKPHVRKYSSKTSNHGFTRKNDDLPYKRYSRFTRHGHPPWSSEVPPAVADVPEDMHAGIGILQFFHGKNIFVTGATGFLGKVFVEKMLRSTPVGKIYLLIKAKDKEAAFDRLEHEIINSELFTCVKEKYGISYVKEKLIPVVGDIREPNLGMDYESIDAVRRNVDVIIQSAANTTFYERYDLMFDTNVIAPQRLMRFAKTCNKLQLFTLISTAFVNEREGIIMEEPLVMGDVNVGDEISVLLKSPSMRTGYDATNFYKQLGHQRAKVFGLSTTYQVSKALGEMGVNEIRGDVPLLIMRPSIVESCFREPLPGWIQGYRMADPVILSYGKGLIPAYYGNPQAPLDFMPVDLVVNTMIAAIAKHGGISVAQPNVYHAASSVSNLLTLTDIFEYLYEYFNASPLVAGAKIAKVEFFDNFEEFSKFTRDEIFRRHKAVGEDRKMIRKCNAKVDYIEQLGKTYEFAGFFKGRFHTSNTHQLIEEMSKEEQLNFEVDVKNIYWKKYLMDTHFPGLRKYLNKNNV